MFLSLGLEDIPMYDDSIQLYMLLHEQRCLNMKV